MTLNDALKELTDAATKSNEKSYIQFSYDNYVILGEAEDVKRAITNYEKTNKVDLLNKDVDTKSGGNAYGEVNKTMICFVDSKKETDDKKEPSNPDSETDVENP